MFSKAVRIFWVFAFFTLISAAVTAQIFAQGANKPMLKVITPAETQAVYGNKIPILFSTENFELVDFQANKVNALGQGHIHLWLDDKNPTAESAVKTFNDQFTFNDVAYGEHELRAELVNNNHTSLTPPVVSTVKFKSSQLSSPLPAAATSGFDKNTALVILIVVALVIAAAWWYTKEEEEEESIEKVTKKTKKIAKRKKRS